MNAISRIKVVARKNHTCQSGYGTISKGDKYERTTITFDGRIYDWKQCLKCKEAMILHEGERYPEGWAKEDGAGCAK